MVEPETRTTEVKIDNGELDTSMTPKDFTEPGILYEKLKNRK